MSLAKHFCDDSLCRQWLNLCVLLYCSTKKVDQFMDFIYLSQVIQAICIDAEAQHYRRLLSTDGIFTRGTLYWQLV